ncbi:hypothetical protein [Methylocapsa acidiphila]|uniref:hypothetical protein n=1 Tax=Methylocapsa acidiphila TaxID=133552 RepID=UPI0012EC9D0E|nr:hypothetical protein [Methylocapsa acidiphila]
MLVTPEAVMFFGVAYAPIGRRRGREKDLPALNRIRRAAPVSRLQLATDIVEKVEK